MGYSSFASFVVFLITIQIGISLGQVTHTVNEGDTLAVKCHGTSGQELFWSRDSPGVYYEEGPILFLENITRSETGTYTCYARDALVNKTVEAVNVDVLYPARIVTWAVNPSEVKANQSFSITCGMEGNPRPQWEIRHNIFPHIVLYRGDGEATITVRNLTGHCGNADNFGQWQCTGYNALNKGVNATKAANLTMCPPRPGVIMVDSNYLCVARTLTKQSFAMYAVGYPYPDFSWSRDDGQPMPVFWKQKDTQSTSELLMTDLQTRDFTANYTLTMTNEIGSYQAHYRLCGTPESPTNLEASNVTQNSVLLTWTSGFDMGCQQHFVVYKNGYAPISGDIKDTTLNHGVGDKWSYLVTYLDQNTEYTFSVQAENKWFLSSYSHDVTVTTLATPSTTPYPDVPNVYHSTQTSVIVIIAIASVGGFLVIVGAVFAFLRYGRHSRMGMVDYPRSKF